MNSILKYTLLLVILGTIAYSKSKILYINSYHESYHSSRIQMKAVNDYLSDDYEVKYIHMNTKVIKQDYLRKLEALKVKKLIETWNPDLVIASDDPASKYVVKEFYKDSIIPFIFIGVNWSVSLYDYPYKNVTGQIEIEVVTELIKELKKYSKGPKIAFLSGATSTDKKALGYYEKYLGLKFNKIKFVKNFSEWKKAYINLQDSVDILIFRSTSGIKNWNKALAKEIITQKTKIPTGSNNSNMSSYVMINFSKDNYEFGEYASITALKILKGTNVSDIPITRNSRAIVSLNMTLAKKLKVIFPLELIDMATLVK